MSTVEPKIKLREYQQEIKEEGLVILKRHQILYLAMEVRTGKTLTALSIADEIAGQVLFVSKKKALPSIESDYQLLDPDFEITTINYASLHKVKPGYDLIIIDEAHGIGAFPKPNQRAQRLRSICAKSRYIIYLTGTPTPESWSQMYHQLWVSGPRSPWWGYSNFYNWARTYVNVKERHISNRKRKDYSEGIASRIIPDISHIKLSYTQEEAGFKSDVDEVVLKVDMGDEVRRLYKDIDKREIAYHNGHVASCTNAADKMNKLHQLCGGTLIFDGDNGDRHYEVISSKKARYIHNYFEGEKIAILYKYQSEGEILKKVFKNYTTDPGEFNQDNDKVFIGQIQSVREGVSLRAAECLVMYSIDFSATSYWQARARTQHKDRAETKLFWVFAEGLLESYVLSRVWEKKNFTHAHYRRLK